MLSKSVIGNEMRETYEFLSFLKCTNQHKCIIIFQSESFPNTSDCRPSNKLDPVILYSITKFTKMLTYLRCKTHTFYFSYEYNHICIFLYYD